MDAQKWNDIPMLNKPLPGLAYEGTVGIRMSHFAHTETVAPSVRPHVVIVRDLLLSVITSTVQHRSLDGTHDLGDIDRLCGAGTLSDSHALLRIGVVGLDILRQDGF